MNGIKWLLLASGALTAVGLAGCLLSVDYNKVDLLAAGGAGGQGGSGGVGGLTGTGGGGSGVGGGAGGAQMCPPWPGMPPADCQTEDSVDNCCFDGRVCGPVGETTCYNGDCAGYAVSPSSTAEWRGKGLAVTDTHVVWGWAASNGTGPGALMRRAIGSTVVEDLTVANDWRPTFMATDGSQVFWLNAHNNMLWAVNAAGETRVVATAGPNVYAGNGRLVVDGNFVYFAMEYDSNSGNSGVWRAGVNDTNAIAVPVADAITPIGVALDADDIYVVEREPSVAIMNGRILRKPRNGGNAEVFVTNAGLRPSELAINDDYVYWVNEGDQVRRADKLTATVTIMQNSQFGVDGVMVDDQYLYWNLQDFMSAEGKVVRVSIYAVPNSVPTVLMDASAPWQIAQNCESVFSVHFDGSTMRATK